MSDALLGGVEAIHVATVLEDCVDQLSVLGRIMPVSYEERPDAEEMVGDEIGQLVDGQKQLESKYDHALSNQKQFRGPQPKSLQDQKLDSARETKNVGQELRNSTYIFARSLKQSPLTRDNLEKVQADRAFLEKILFGTLLELTNSGGFQTLTEAVRYEKEKKARLQQTIQKEEEGRRRVRLLRQQLETVKREKEVEIQDRSEMIAHLKDQLQEMKAKTNMEGKYIKKSAEVSVAQTQKKCVMSEKEMKEAIDELKVKIDEENRVNAEIESYLRSYTDKMQTQVEYWKEKFETDTAQKQKDLDVLKASKAKDLERLKELTKMYAEYEQVVVEDRIEKEKARRKAEQEADELKAAVLLQSWWRGIMVRRGLGPYNKKKKKRGKKGKGKGKKKKK